MDKDGLYGSDEYAMKAAAHELNGMMYYYNCQISQLNLPLMCLIDYRGYRLVAMSLLPVSKETIIYGKFLSNSVTDHCQGSSDAGKTVHNDDKEFEELMATAAKRLNLAPHLVGPDITRSETIYAPVDIEGHKSQIDGCYYLLDFARYFDNDPSC